ncbi:MAG TPA: conjugal transfer protein TraD, partial [Thermoanaerobaculia bacterium]
MRRPILTPAQRSVLLSVCTAVYGLAVAFATYPHWLKAAPAGQLPGYMTSEGLNANASFRFYLTLVILPLLSTLLFRPVVERLTRPDTRAWARNGFAWALLTAPWYVSVARQDILWTALPGLIAATLFTLLRRVDVDFSRRDAILLPTFASVLIGLVDMTKLPVERAMPIAAGIVIVVRILTSSFAFAAAPLGLVLQTHFFARDQRYAGWPAIAIAVLTPFVLRAFVKNRPDIHRRIRVAVAFAIFPIVAYSYVSAVSLYTAEHFQRVDLFEDSHHLAPGWEIFHGARPYKDVVPMHGLLDDGLLDAAIMRFSKPNIGAVMKIRGTISTLIGPALYFLAFAATGSPEAGILAFFATVMMGYSVGGLRFVPSLVVLAFVVAALRRRNARLLGWAGGLCVVAGLTGLDMGLYSGLVTLAGILRFPDRKRAFKLTSIGVAIVFGVALIGMLIGGFLVDFFRVSLFEIANLGPVYTLRPMEGGPPQSLDRQFPEILTAVFDQRGMMYLGWIASMVIFAVMLTRRGARRLEPLFVMAVFVLATGISYAERQHIYYHFILPGFIATAAYILFRRRSTAARLGGVALVAILVVLTNFTIHFAIDTYLRRTHAPTDPLWREVGLPTGRLALFHEQDIEFIDTVQRWTASHLGPGDTFYDFTDHA